MTQYLIDELYNYRSRHLRSMVLKLYSCIDARSRINNQSAKGGQLPVLKRGVEMETINSTMIAMHGDDYGKQCCKMTDKKYNDQKENQGPTVRKRHHGHPRKHRK
jgi:hypothetical protein